MRCDIKPTGWEVVAGGPDPTNVSGWRCENRSISSDPSHCQWGLFWEPLPDNASYAGREEVDGRLCNRWDYWRGGERYAQWSTAFGLPGPVATGKTWTAHPGYHLWRIIWRDYEPFAPPLAKFAPTTGLHCPPANRPATPTAAWGGRSRRLGYHKMT